MSGPHALGGAVCCWALLLLAVAPADAAQRFATPVGNGTACSEAVPCGVETAVEGAASNDEVIVAPGTYDLGSGDLFASAASLTVHGQAGAPRPLIKSTDSLLRGIGPNQTYRDLRILQTATTGQFGILLRNGALGERLEVTAAGGFGACSITNGVVLRDSICHSTAPSSFALRDSTASDSTTTVENVTAIATGTASEGIILQASSGVDVTMNLRNVIAQGDEFDIEAFTSTDADSSVTANLIASNYDTTSATFGPGTESVTPPGTAGGQTAAPLLADVAAGDLRQLPGSPTIDSGVTSPFAGALDFEGDPRVQRASVDIGADESDGVPPETTIDSGPAPTTANPISHLHLQRGRCRGFRLHA